MKINVSHIAKRLKQAFAFRRRRPTVYFGLNGMDRLIESACGDAIGPGRYYIEAGANDGKAQSNTYFLEKKYGMRGLLVEPDPVRYIDLKKNRAADNDFACAALVPAGYLERFVPLVRADLMSVALINQETDLPDVASHLESARRFMREGDEQFEFGALAKPISQILDDANAPEIIDIFSLDVEGNELNVLKGFDFDKRRIRYLVVECRDISRLQAHLSGKGMMLRDKLTHHDYLFSSDS